MNAKDKLKHLMGAKARRMWLLGIKDWHLYYGPEDAEEIDRWDDYEADAIWYRIHREIVEYSGGGLTAATCPWCQGFSCSGCGYGKRHLECALEGSDLWHITSELRRKWPFDIDKFWHRVCFSNEWYREVVERIEGENA